MASHPIVLTIAGSDSSGGAGIQADIKTLSALGAYSASVITSVTAQNTLGVQAVHPLPTAIIDAQLRAVFDDLAISCVKIGMLNTASTIHLVAQILREYRPKYVVLDPVMISSSGKSLIEAEAIHALVSELFPVSTLITPNIPEAAAILGSPPAQSKVEMHAALKELSQLGSSFTLLKGGHLPGKLCIDLLAENKTTLKSILAEEKSPFIKEIIEKAIV